MRRPWLAPLAPLYAAGAALRARLIATRRLRWPVVSIGNLSTGGSGKTPLTIELARLLTEHGFAVDVLSRGYGRRSTVPLRVDPDGDAGTYGDEPLLIARATGLPVYVAPQRYDAGLLAEAQHQEQEDAPLSREIRAHILDDGFQHRQLARDADILLLNREDWRDALLPAGNLREALGAAKRADAMVIPADDAELEEELRQWGWQGPVWRVRRWMEVPPVDGPVLAFCGIARPEQFFAGLEAAGVKIAARIAFRDHYRYRPADINDLVDAATLPSAGISALVSTEKDIIRLGRMTAALPNGLPLLTAHLKVEFDDEAAVVEWLSARLYATGAQQPL